MTDQRGRRPRHKRIKAGTIELLCRLKRDVHADFSLRQMGGREAVWLHRRRKWRSPHDQIEAGRGGITLYIAIFIWHLIVDIDWIAFVGRIAQEGSMIVVNVPECVD